MNGRTHLGEALRWSTEAKVELVEVLSAGVGMAGPVLLAAVTGHLTLGLAASLGSFVVGGGSAGASARSQAKLIALAFGAASLASIAAALAVGHGWISDAIVVLLAAIAALIGGYSRPLAAAATRFMFVLIIIARTADAASGRTGLLLLLVAGALWTTIVSLSIGALARMGRRSDNSDAGASVSSAAAAQQFLRWRSTLTRTSGWQYALRLALCLSAAEALRSLWPKHHLYWIAVTVVILLQRRIETLPVKATQRALGTLIGVLVASIFLIHMPTSYELIMGIGFLAGARPLLRARNYLAYSAVMAPLVILLMDGTGPFGADVLVDRLVATIMGAALVVAANWGAGKIVNKNTTADQILIRRGPVLTLWAAVVAERLGFEREEALTLGRAVTELSASATAAALKTSHPGSAASKEAESHNALKCAEALRVSILQREVPAMRTLRGVRALSRGEPIEPASVELYLESKFGDKLGAARTAMVRLARSCATDELNERAFALYEAFRPEVPAGPQGWGAAGVLDLGQIEKLTVQ